MKLLILLLCTLSLALAKSACPLAGKCPYVTQKSSDGAEKPCPLEKANCPYFEKHKKDSSLEDVLAADAAGCPMEKCPYFEVFKIF